MKQIEILKIFVHITQIQKLESRIGTTQMILFDGTCSGSYLNGKILPGGVDTQQYGTDSGTGGILSARYMIEGIDFSGTCCRLYIENESKAGEKITYPKIRTDSMALQWLETAELSGTLGIKNGTPEITVYASLPEDTEIRIKESENQGEKQ